MTLPRILTALPLVMVVVVACDDARREPGGIIPLGNASSVATGGSTSGGVGGGGGAGGAAGHDAVEQCFDGVDGDGDGLVDCADADPDCATACEAPCAHPVALTEGEVQQLDLGGFEGIGASCGVAGGIHSHVLEVTPSVTGALDVFVESEADVTLHINETCEVPSGESLCVNRTSPEGAAAMEHLTTDATAGVPVHVLVTSADGGASLPYQVVASSRERRCGDGFLDALEQCDDGNSEDDDGCESCQVVPTETEPNDAVAEADVISSPTYGLMGASEDVDVFSFFLDGPDQSALLTISDFGGGSCGLGILDTQVMVLSSQQSVVASDDDGSEGTCSRVGIAGHSAGTYYARITSMGTTSFPAGYVLTLELGRCGNGLLEAAEQCDDGNLIDHDGCSSGCTPD